MEMQNRKLRSIGTFVVGGLIGAGVAILFAPQSGRRTRRELRHMGKKVLHKSEALGMDLRNSLDNLVDDISGKLKDGVARGRDWSQRAKKDVRNIVESGRSYVH